MDTELKKESLIVFSDISILDIKSLLKIHSSPFIVMKNHLEILGILDEGLFLKKLDSVGQNQKIIEYLNLSFVVVDDLDKLNEEDMSHYDFAIQHSDNQYRCYPIYEVRGMILKKKLKSLISLNKSLNEELEVTRKKVKELTQILHSSYDEIFVTDANGDTLFVSESCKKLTGLPPEAFINKNIKELVEKGLIVNSVTLKTMKTKAVHSAEQTYPHGLTVFCTAKPIFDEEGNLYRIVSNSRDITELVEMKSKLNQVNLRNQLTQNEHSQSKKTVSFNNFITNSNMMINVLELAEKVAPMDSSIFIHGETGVGKGVLARIIHDLSNRKDKKFIQVNCGAIPSALIESELFGYESGAFTGANKHGKQGLVEMADGGTLFLDEIGEMPLDIQVKILHLVQDRTFMKVGGTKEKKVNIRIISATNKDLKQMIKNNQFREDLYYRLHVVPMEIPQLRERKEDILLLTDYFLKKFNEKYGQSITIDDHSKLILQLQDYPGNVRELENVIEQIVVTARKPIVTIEDLPSDLTYKDTALVNLTGIIPLKKALEETEKQLLSQALSTYKSTRKMAKALEVSQTTIMRKLGKYQFVYDESK
ncbi:sigma 54-interacting transcriptional regulator [Peribacillus butanolivorans]|uniref:sigma-54 interaction domain-containing protein n=1 Tax=Peribacillus butanolivorans TaxID=421767 RepID=UPI00207D3993|nr:sigma 54-interacting transcriptional regulator [Peribacillus butanolivorans]MCO0597779.1 sigma 54-interacting transcriptional regulator [Peribacillus butanolivorans]